MIRNCTEMCEDDLGELILCLKVKKYVAVEGEDIKDF